MGGLPVESVHAGKVLQIFGHGIVHHFTHFPQRIFDGISG